VEVDRVNAGVEELLDLGPVPVGSSLISMWALEILGSYKLRHLLSI